MFDFLSYVRDSSLEIRLLPPGPGILISLELRDAESGYFEHHDITNKEAASCGNIDAYTGRVLDQMVARIGRKKAKLYADRHQGNQMREREKFFKGE